MRPSPKPPRRRPRSAPSGSCRRVRASASQLALTSLSLPEKPPIAATSAPSMTCVAGARLGGDGDRAAAVRARCRRAPPSARRCRRRTCRRRRRRRAGRRPAPPAGGAKPPARRRRAAEPPRRGPPAAAARAPPIPALCGPPAGNVPLVAWPSVCADHAAGAISSAPIAAPSAIARRGRNASAAAAAIPAGDQHARQPARASPGCRAGSSPRRRRRPARRAAPSTRAVVPPSESCAAPAPTSAAVNGASSET